MSNFLTPAFFAMVTRLYRGAVKSCGGSFMQVFQVSGFMVKQVNPFYFFRQTFIINSICTISIAFRLVVAMVTSSLGIMVPFFVI